MKKLVYLSLGSNLGDREANLQAAADCINASGIRVIRCSSTYETRPMYLRDQPLFLNLVLEVETDILPRLLLRKLQEIERKLGRKRAPRNGPRLIDIDIILYGAFVIDAPELCVPHPRMHERRFVLEPLAELVPDLRHPVSRKTMRELLSAVPPGGVRKVAFRLETPAAP